MVNTQSFQLDEVEISALTWGREGAPKLLLLHGYLDIAHGWAPFAEALADEYHIFAPHFRGHGDSSWAPGSHGYAMTHYVYDWVQLLDLIGWDTGLLMGHSMGANCAAILAGTYPEKFQRVALIEGFGVPTWQEDDAPERLRDHIARRLPDQRKANKTFASLEDVAARIRKSNPRYTEAHTAFLAQHAARQGDDGSWHWKFDPMVRIPNPAMYLMSQFRAFWRRIAAPTLHVIGADSPYAAFAPMAGWNTPEMDIVYLPGAMHMVQHEIPGQLAQVTRNFFAGRSDALAPFRAPKDAT